MVHKLPNTVECFRGVVLAHLSEAPPQLAEDLASLHVAWSEGEAEQMNKQLLNYALLCNNGNATPSLVFNRRAKAHIRHPVAFPCSEKLKVTLVHWQRYLLSTVNDPEQLLLGRCSASDVRGTVQASFGTSKALSRIRTSFACSALSNGRSTGEVAHCLGFSNAHVESISNSLAFEKVQE